MVSGQRKVFIHGLTARASQPSRAQNELGGPQPVIRRTLLTPVGGSYLHGRSGCFYLFADEPAALCQGESEVRVTLLAGAGNKGARPGATPLDSWSSAPSVSHIRLGGHAPYALITKYIRPEAEVSPELSLEEEGVPLPGDSRVPRWPGSFLIVLLGPSMPTAVEVVCVGGGGAQRMRRVGVMRQAPSLHLCDGNAKETISCRDCLGSMGAFHSGGV